MMFIRLAAAGDSTKKRNTIELLLLYKLHHGKALCLEMMTRRNTKEFVTTIFISMYSDIKQSVCFSGNK